MRIIWREGATQLDSLINSKLILDLGDISLIFIILLIGILGWSYYVSQVKGPQNSLDDFPNESSEGGDASSN